MKNDLDLFFLEGFQEFDCIETDVEAGSCILLETNKLKQAHFWNISEKQIINLFQIVSYKPLINFSKKIRKSF